MIDKICSPLVYENFISHIDLVNVVYYPAPMVFRKGANFLKWKDVVNHDDAGVLTMYTTYSMTDTFVQRDFIIGIGVGTTRVIEKLDFKKDWEYQFMQHESDKYRDDASLE